MMSNSESRAAAVILAAIRRLAVRPVRLMEVCGTHTAVIWRSGLHSMLLPQVELVSGPGCPVCVTPGQYIDRAVAYSRMENVIIASFGDMLRVPGSESSLLQEKAAGRDIRVVYSPLEALTLAADNPSKRVVFLSVGFETTAPAAAATIINAKTMQLSNFFVAAANKLLPPVLRSLLTPGGAQIDGLLLPGHVCAVSGSSAFDFVATDLGQPAAVAGFDPLGILQAVWLILRQLAIGEARVDNAYAAVVRREGNPAALEMLSAVFEPIDSIWRGFGLIADSGLQLRDAWRQFDAQYQLPVAAGDSGEPPGCRCGDVLRGVISPAGCTLFAVACRPDKPAGPCMVSGEGACAVWYKYGRGVGRRGQ